MIILFALAASVFTAGIIVSAYFAAYTSRENIVYVGDDVIEISEDFKPPVEQIVGENVYTKKITVVNHGTTPCYVRVYADFSDGSIRSRSSLSNNGTQFYKADRDPDAPDTYVHNLGFTAPEWEFVPDDDTSSLAGFYYYKVPLKAGKSTPPLFTYVKTAVSGSDEILQHDIDVYAESVQVTDLNGYAYPSFSEAWTDYLSRSE